MPALRVEGVEVSFGGLSALHDTTLGVAAGSVTGLIGPNGAGKTTLFDVITGLQRPNHGRVLLDGREITSMRPHVRARLGIARTFQRLELFGSLTAMENILVAAELHRRHFRPKGQALQDRRRPLVTQERPRLAAQEILERVGLRDNAEVQADNLPTGMARLVELGRALATKPSLLLLDEPSSGLDHSETSVLGNLLVDLAATGMAILLVEHDMDLVMRICQKIYVLDFGQIIAAGTPAEIKVDQAVQAAYLGIEAPSSGSSNGAGPGTLS